MKIKARNSANTKLHNRKYIINMIREKKISRVDIARETGLTRAGITKIIDELINDGIVVESGSINTMSGRKPVELDINPSRYYSLGLDISRGSCVFGAIDFKGKVLFKKDLPIFKNTPIKKSLDIIIENVREIINNNKEWGELLGLGISAPGPLDVDTGTILNPPNFKQWHGIKIVDLLKKEFDFKVFLENNSIAHTLGEKNYGWGKEINSFMLLVVDTGIGAGIIINNRLYKGMKGFGAAIGHTCIDINGEKCNCGNIGCVELYASIPSIIKYAKGKGVKVDSWNQIVDNAESGDITCKELIEKEATYLGAAIVNTINILELEAVILTGYIGYKPEAILSMIKKYANQHCINRNIRSVPIYISAINEDAKIISAATIAIDKFCS